MDFTKKMNVGVVCLGLALILGKMGGMGAADIYSCTSLWAVIAFGRQHTAETKRNGRPLIATRR